MKQLKAIKKADNVTIIFGEWFDKLYGNTYYDAEVFVNGQRFKVPYGYGYNAGDRQAIDEALANCGYRVRNNKRHPWSAYSSVNTRNISKLKRELYK